jgi:hypothetical protein
MIHDKPKRKNTENVFYCIESHAPIGVGNWCTVAVFNEYVDALLYVEDHKKIDPRLLIVKKPDTLWERVCTMLSRWF